MKLDAQGQLNYLRSLIPGGFFKIFTPKTLAKMTNLDARRIEQFVEEDEPLMSVEVGQLFEAVTELRSEQDTKIVRDALFPEQNEVQPEIPDQNPLFRFGISGDHLTLLPPPADGNDYDAIEALRAELFNPLNSLTSLYEGKPNRPQSEMFEPLVEGYLAELSKDSREINFITLYARGKRFYSSRAQADVEIGQDEWPDFDPNEREWIDTVCDLHGVLMMQSAAGRKIVTDARDFENTPDDDRREQQLIAEFGETVANEPGLLDDETAETVVTLTAVDSNEGQPERSRVVKIGIMGSMLTLVVGGGGAAAGVAFTSGNPVLAAILGGGTWAANEAVKTMPSFKEGTKAAGEVAEGLKDKATDRVQRMLARVAKATTSTVMELGSMRSEFEWTRRAGLLAVPKFDQESLPLEKDHSAIRVAQIGIPDQVIRRISFGAGFDVEVVSFSDATEFTDLSFADHPFEIMLVSTDLIYDFTRLAIRHGADSLMIAIDNFQLQSNALAVALVAPEHIGPETLNNASAVTHYEIVTPNGAMRLLREMGLRKTSSI